MVYALFKVKTTSQSLVDKLPSHMQSLLHTHAIMNNYEEYEQKRLTGDISEEEFTAADSLVEISEKYDFSIEHMHSKLLTHKYNFIGRIHPNVISHEASVLVNGTDAGIYIVKNKLAKTNQNYFFESSQKKTHAKWHAITDYRTQDVRDDYMNRVIKMFNNKYGSTPLANRPSFDLDETSEYFQSWMYATVIDVSGSIDDVLGFREGLLDAKLFNTGFHLDNLAFR